MDGRKNLLANNPYTLGCPYYMNGNLSKLHRASWDWFLYDLNVSSRLIKNWRTLSHTPWTTYLLPAPPPLATFRFSKWLENCFDRPCLHKMGDKRWWWGWKSKVNKQACHFGFCVWENNFSGRKKEDRWSIKVWHKQTQAKKQSENSTWWHL